MFNTNSNLLGQRCPGSARTSELLVYKAPSDCVQRFAADLSLAKHCVLICYSVLEEGNALDLLRDDRITIATAEIYSQGRSRREIQRDIKRKEQALEALSAKYSNKSISRENVRQCIYSISDNHAFLRVNRDPCEKMIELLKKHFHPTNPESNKTSLAIRSGKGGARLTHDHQR